MQQITTTLIGKLAKKVAKLRGGSGSAWPGLVVEKIDSDFVARTLNTLPRGVVLISGTNGKTTTTKIVTELLGSQGLKVFTNRTGSNFTRGVAAALLDEVSLSGRLDADIAVLELDEAYAVHFVRRIKPTYCLLLNVMRDQLDRFGEIDTTAKLLQTVAENTAKAVVLNANDPRLTSKEFLQNVQAPVFGYSLAESLEKLFPSDDNMRHANESKSTTGANIPIAAQLWSMNNQSAVIRLNNKNHSVKLALRGVYNLQNATGALALVKTILGKKINEKNLLKKLATIKPAFGRGEQLTVNRQPCELVLVKNPAGFRLALSSFDAKNYATMIAINDEYADGRDMSWLWDVDFHELKEVFITSGVRAYDMALRLQYDEVAIGEVDTDLAKALDIFITKNSLKPKRIYCSYTAMLTLRRLLAKYTTIEDIA